MPAPAVESIYPYKPNKAVIFVAIVLYGIGACVHVFQMFRYRAWYYMPFAFGATLMTFGYIMRFISSKSPAELTPYILQYLSILLPPSLYAATIYMIYGRIVTWLFPDDRTTQRGERVSLIPARWVTKVFVIGDVISFIAQIAGGGLTAVDGQEDMGEKILLAGLAVQLISFGTFLTLAVVFERRAARLFSEGYVVPSSATGADGRGTAQVRRKLMLFLFFGSAMIIGRCAFRIIEYAQGHDGYLVTREVFLYVFDTLPMVIVQYAFHFGYAGKVLPQGVGKRSEKVELKDTASRNSSRGLTAV